MSTVITAQMVSVLREKTGAGLLDCKKALTEANADFDQAETILRKKGVASAAKKADRTANDGLIESYIHLGGKVGVLIEVNCETDFVARTDDFTALGERLARAVAEDAAVASVDALLAAPLDGEKAQDRIVAAIAKLGENVVVKRVARLAVDSGVVGGYVHAGGKLGVLVALEADEAGAGLEALARDVSMHVAAADPTPVAVSREGVSAELLASEREIYRKQALAEGKPEKIIDKIVEGKLNKYVSEIALVEQPFVKDPDKSVGDLLATRGAVNVSGFERFKLGRGDEAEAE